MGYRSGVSLLSCPSVLSSYPSYRSYRGHNKVFHPFELKNFGSLYQRYQWKQWLQPERDLAASPMAVFVSSSNSFAVPLDKLANRDLYCR